MRLRDRHWLPAHVEVERAGDVHAVAAHEEPERAADARVHVEHLVLSVARVIAIADVENAAISQILHPAPGRLVDDIVPQADA